MPDDHAICGPSKHQLVWDPFGLPNIDATRRRKLKHHKMDKNVRELSMKDSLETFERYKYFRGGKSYFDAKKNIDVMKFISNCLKALNAYKREEWSDRQQMRAVLAYLDGNPLKYMTELMRKSIVTNMTEFFEQLRSKYMCKRTSFQRNQCLNDIKLPAGAVVDDIKNFVTDIGTALRVFGYAQNEESVRNGKNLPDNHQHHSGRSH